jgi:hypothetical protein
MILAVVFDVVAVWAVQRFVVVQQNVSSIHCFFGFMSARPSSTETMRAVADDKHGERCIPFCKS